MPCQRTDLSGKERAHKLKKDAQDTGHTWRDKQRSTGLCPRTFITTSILVRNCSCNYSAKCLRGSMECKALLIQTEHDCRIVNAMQGSQLVNCYIFMIMQDLDAAILLTTGSFLLKVELFSYSCVWVLFLTYNWSVFDLQLELFIDSWSFLACNECL